MQEHWTGTTGMVLLAPQLVKLKKKDLGLPHVSKATERQKKDGMCYSDDAEIYNGGNAFKVRDAAATAPPPRDTRRAPG